MTDALLSAMAAGSLLTTALLLLAAKYRLYAACLAAGAIASVLQALVAADLLR
jgi:hypothetical protein